MTSPKTAAGKTARFHALLEAHPQLKTHFEAALNTALETRNCRDMALEEPIRQALLEDDIKEISAGYMAHAIAGHVERNISSLVKKHFKANRNSDAGMHRKVFNEQYAALTKDEPTQRAQKGRRNPSKGSHSSFPGIQDIYLESEVQELPPGFEWLANDQI